MQIELVPCLSDNYAFLLHEPTAGVTAVVDPAEVAPVEAALAARGWRLTHILNTHHHWDHVGGNEALKAAHGCTVVGPAADAARIPGIDVQLKDGDRWARCARCVHMCVCGGQAGCGPAAGRASRRAGQGSQQHADPHAATHSVHAHTAATPCLQVPAGCRGAGVL